MKKQLILSTTVFMLAVGAASAQTAAPAFVPAQGQTDRLTSDIIGMNVKNTAGEKLGDINYLVMDSARKVTTAVIGVGGFLGIGEKNVAVPFETLTASTDADGRSTLVLNTTKEALQAAPKFETLRPTLTHRAKEAYDATKQKAGEAYDATKQKAGEAYDATKQKAGEVYDATKQKAGEAADATRDAARDAGNATRDAARDAGNAANDATRPATTPAPTVR